MVGDEVRLLEAQQDGLQDLVEVVDLQRRRHEAHRVVAAVVIGRVLPPIPELLCAGELLADLGLA